MKGETKDCMSRTGEVTEDPSTAGHTQQRRGTPQRELTPAPLVAHRSHPVDIDIDMVVILILVLACYHFTGGGNIGLLDGRADGLTVAAPTRNVPVSTSAEAVRASSHITRDGPAVLGEDRTSPQHTGIVHQIPGSYRGWVWRVLAATAKRVRPLDHGRRWMMLASHIKASSHPHDSRTQYRRMARKIAYAVARYAIQLGQQPGESRDLSDNIKWPVPLRRRQGHNLRGSVDWALRTVVMLHHWHRTLNSDVCDNVEPLPRREEANRLLSNHVRDSLDSELTMIAN